MKVVATRFASMSGLRAARAVAAAWVILAFGGTGLEAQGVVPPGLVSWWRAEGNALDAQAANSGALVGPVAFVPGRVGQAFRLAGSGYVEVLNSTTLEPSTITVAAWVRGVAPGADRYILSKGAIGCLAASYALFTASNGELYFSISDGHTFTLSPSGGAGVWDGQWHFVTGTFEDPSTVRLYVDGVEIGGGVATAIQINYAAATNDKLYVGAYRGSCNYSFTGDIDEVQTYDRALDASQILSLFQGASVSFTSLAGTGAAVPGYAGVFTSFPQSPAMSGSVAAFLGLGSAGSQGIYLGDVSVPPNPIRVADGTTPIPQGIGTFTGFSELSISDVAQPTPPPIRVAFIGSGVSQQGIYLSEFTNASIPLPPPIKVANLATAIPGGTGSFTAFSELVISDVATPVPPPIRIGFIGSGLSQQGIYLSQFTDVSVPPNPVRVADRTTSIPQGAGTFTAFSRLSIADTAMPSPPPIRVAFIGSGASQQGVYLSEFTNASIPLPPPIKVADLTTTIPGGAGSFTAFGDVSVSEVAAPNPPPIRVAFIGNGASQQGVYLSEFTNVSFPQPPPIKVADLTTPIPGGSGNFTGFSALTSSLGHTAFLGQGSSGQAGIYLASTLTKLIAVGDQLAGKTVAALRLGRFGLDGHTLSFTAGFTDGSEAVFAAGVNVLTFDFSGFFEPLENLPAVNLVKAGQSVPVKFSLGGNRGLDIFAAGYPRSEQIACVSGAEVNGVDETAAAGASSLSYDPATDQYTYVWKTTKGWAKTCRQLVLRLLDGSVHRVNFTFK